MITRRRMLAATGGLAALAAGGPAGAGGRSKAPTISTLTLPTTRRTGTMQIMRNGSQPSERGPADYFTGSVRIDSRFQRSDPARAGGALVTFEPGARTAWHTHPLGQTLIVTAGRGWAQREGGPVEEIRPGDVVWFEPGEKHWHGHDPHRHRGGARRQGRRLAGACQRPTIPSLTTQPIGHRWRANNAEAKTRRQPGGFGHRPGLHWDEPVRAMRLQ
jgi:quercetin dioxygenase-like cupin family protein